MEPYNVKEIIFQDGTVDTRIYKHDVFNRHIIERKKREENKELSEKEIEDNIRRSCSRAKQKIYEISRNETWEWFVTLTLDPKKVDRYDYEDCTKKVSKWLNNLRKQCCNLKYIIVPELHKDGAYHFHGLFTGIDDYLICYSGHDHYETGDAIYNLEVYKFGWSTMTRVKNNDAVVKYLTKYITKNLIGSVKGKKKYWVSRNVERPCVAYSELEDMEKCFLKQELDDECSYSNEYLNKFNSVVYYQSS